MAIRQVNYLQRCPQGCPIFQFSVIFFHQSEALSLPVQSPRDFSALARPTKTAMLRRLGKCQLFSQARLTGDMCRKYRFPCLQNQNLR